MPSRVLILRILVVATLIALAHCGVTYAAPPNVVLIMVDDLGWMDLHCQGNERLNTPRIDALAKQGIRFTNAYAASPVCSPTRGAMITGLAPARLRITQHGQDGPAFWPKDRPLQPPVAEHRLPLATITLAERLKLAGYATGFFGKWHLSGEQDAKEGQAGGPAFWPEHQGFDINIGGCGFGGPPTYFDPYRIPAIKSRKKGEYLTDRLADETVTFMRAGHHKPMFICLWTYNVHYPFEAPQELVAKYQGNEGAGLKNAVYGAQVEATDRAVGKVLDEIDRLGIADKTLVILTSDNGGWEGATDNRPLRSGKGDLYEGGLRVPLVVRWPKLPDKGSVAGTSNDTPVISMDLPATILDVAQVTLERETKLDGTSLRPLLQGKKLERDDLYFHYPHYAWHRSNRPGGAIRSGQYKLIRRYDDNSVELFDLQSDIGETQNLAQQLPEVAAKLRERLDRWLQDTAAQMPTRIKKTE
ncbi:Arylsulfatase [Anatilimnocola aggregata]|uniref:Arylsulfatase n=1 Tax=Anatilimnocola aggregata TaxID=2528021 RepID=A0A517YA22_9BACT|nr:sulfatase [Anatilimnocola aggregata]QDU27085.1 Arylsulfatase [Anatilimnocola aggregata]